MGYQTDDSRARERIGDVRAVSLDIEMTDDAAPTSHSESRELPVAELLRRARPLPPLEEMVIDDLSDEEREAFLIAIQA